MPDKNSSQLDINFLNETDETFTVDLNDLSNTITVNTDFTDYSNGTYTINTSFNEFEDTMPSIDKIKGMCEQYPAFKKEFDKFRQMYMLMKDDYEANNDDTEIPF